MAPARLLTSAVFVLALLVAAVAMRPTPPAAEIKQVLETANLEYSRIGNHYLCPPAATAPHGGEMAGTDCVCLDGRKLALVRDRKVIDIQPRVCSLD